MAPGTDNTTSAGHADTVQVRIQHSLLSANCALPLALFNALFAGLLALMMWGAVPVATLRAWVAVACLLSLSDILVRLVVRRTGGPSLRWPVLASDAGVGLAWLFAALAFFPTDVPALQFYFLFSIGGAALCTAVYQHYWLVACFARIGVAMPVAGWQLLTTDASFAILRAAILTAVWMVIAWLAYKLHQSLLQRLQLTATRDALLRQVAESARALDVLREDEARSRAEAEQANLAKSRFLAHSSHDLRQPLHAIRLLLETVDDSTLDEASVHVIERVRHSTDALGKLFDSLLDLTLLDTGQVSVQQRDVNVRELLMEVADDFAELARSNEVALEVQATAHQAAADPTVLRRMVQNLVANAIRHTPRGTVLLRTREMSGQLWLDVEDTGSGVAAQDQERIFEEFTRIADATAGQSGERLGLGLSIVSRLARFSNVSVTLDSAPGRGSRFTLGPFHAHLPHGAPVNPAALAAASLAGQRVVVLDDDAETLEATGRLLKKWGLAVRLADRAEHLGLDDADILICDVELGPGPDGIDVVRQAQAATASRIKPLLISGNASAALKARARAHALTLLHKPVQPAQLKSAILTLVGNDE
ncbi:MAG: hybrid sensor histidine kinase/response regulator [Pseudomonadota bacterium]